MSQTTLPAGLTTAALLKSRLDRGKDYFDLLLPFAQKAVALSKGEVVDPMTTRDCIASFASIQLPIRTVAVLLDRLVRVKQLRKEGGMYLKVVGELTPPIETRDQQAVAKSFEQLGQSFLDFAETKGEK